MQPDTTSKPSSKLEWALWLVDKYKLGIFPVWETKPDGSCACGDLKCKSVGKHPAISNNLENASTDQEMIRRWWKANPGRNIGMVPDANHVLVDLDLKNGNDGCKALADMMDMSVGQLINITTRFTTPTLGHHLLFKTSGIAYQNSAGKVGPGIDVRGPEGYVVATGSTIWKSVDGEMQELAYTLEHDVPIVMLPDKIVKALLRVPDKKKNKSRVPVGNLDTENRIKSAIGYLRRQKPSKWDGTGNNTTYKTAAALCEHGVSIDRAMDLLMERKLIQQPDGSKVSWNQASEPPWGYEELLITVGNAFKHGQDAPGTADMIELLSISEGDDIGESLTDDDYEAMMNKIEGAVIIPASTDSKPAVADASADVQMYERLKAHFKTVGEFIDTTAPFEFALENWIAYGGVNIILGIRGSGKTTMFVDMICRLTHDLPWNGQHMDKGVSALIASLEDAPGLAGRFDAWFAAHPDVKRNDRRLRVLDFPLNIFADDIELVLRNLKRLIMEGMDNRRFIFGVDTWQRLTEKAPSQSDDHYMGLAMTRLEDFGSDIVAAIPSDKNRRACSLVACHPPKGNENTTHGAANIENKSMVIMQVKKDDPKPGLRKVQITRSKGGAEDDYITFEIKAKLIPGKSNSEGRPIRGAVVHYVGAMVSGGTTTSEAAEAYDLEQKIWAVDLVLAMHTRDEMPLAQLTKVCGAGSDSLWDTTADHQALLGDGAAVRKIPSRSTFYREVPKLLRNPVPLPDGKRKVHCENRGTETAKDLWLVITYVNPRLDPMRYTDVDLAVDEFGDTFNTATGEIVVTGSTRH